jgi:transcription elongation factor Elf1
MTKNSSRLFRCTRCDIPKPVSQFHVKRAIKRGHKAQCVDCDRELQRQADAAWRPRVDPAIRAWLLRP